LHPSDPVVGKPSSAIEVQFKAKKGVQSLQSLEGAPPDTLSLLSGSAPAQAIGLTTKVKQGGKKRWRSKPSLRDSSRRCRRIAV
jgi:hypothetical protein